jgi:hypothetical protein
MSDPRKKAAPEPQGFPLWGTLAIPAGLLWGTVLGAGAGFLLGDLLIGALIGAALGIGIGLTLFAAAIVVASGRV